MYTIRETSQYCRTKKIGKTITVEICPISQKKYLLLLDVKLHIRIKCIPKAHNLLFTKSILTFLSSKSFPIKCTFPSIHVKWRVFCFGLVIVAWGKNLFLRKCDFSTTRIINKSFFLVLNYALYCRNFEPAIYKYTLQSVQENSALLLGISRASIRLRYGYFITTASKNMDCFISCGCGNKLAQIVRNNRGRITVEVIDSNHTGCLGYLQWYLK